MSFLTRLLAVNPNVDVNDERAWTAWGTWGRTTAAGVAISPDTALKLSTVFGCVRLLSETIASLPLVCYKRLANGAREDATEHPLYDLLHDRPNANQTAIEFRQMMTAHMLLRGNGFARILAGRRGFVDQLVPVHPDLVRMELLPDGGLRYRVRRGPPPVGLADSSFFNGAAVSGEWETLDDSEMLHIKGLSLNGLTGVAVVSYAREAFGLALGAEAYGARYFGNGSRPGGVLKTPNKLSKDGAQRLKNSWESAQGGQNQHRVAVLEEGLEWVQTGLSNKDSQFLELRNFQAEDVCRWFGVPPHMVGLTSKVTSWGSGIEQLGLAFVAYTLLPWLKRWEQAISRDLIIAPRTYFVEHNVAGLLRGDLKARYEAYAIGRDKGWLSVNDVRRLENLNPIDGGDDYGTADSGAPGTLPSRAPERAQPDDEGDEGDEQDEGEGESTTAHHRLLVHEAAGRVVRKEVAAMTRAARRNGGEGSWARAVDEFYADHAEFVAQTLRISAEIANRYVAAQVAELQAGPTAMNDWESRRVADLVALVLEAA